MPRRSLGLALFVCVLALALASCVSSEELRQEEEATCTGYGFHRGTDAFASCLQKESLARRYWDLSPPRIGVGDGVTGRARVGAVLAVTRGPGAGASRTWMPSAARPRTAASGTRGISPVLRLFRREQGGGRGWLQSVQGGPWSRVGGKGRARLPCGEAKRTARP